MPRAPSEKAAEAEKLFQKGMSLVDIADNLGVSDGTVRSWKNRYGWGDTSKKNKCNVAKKSDTENATLQKRKKGGQPNNKNAKGGSGNPHPNPPPDMTKHGGYRAVFMDALDEDEQELVATVPADEEQLLLEQIQLFSIRERRILKAINKYREQTGDVAVADVSRMEEERTFNSKEEEAEYNRRQKEKVDSGKRLPGNPYSISTHTTNKDLIIARLEQELSTVQSKKTKSIETLARMHIEQKKMDGDTASNDVVKTWAEKVLKARREHDGQ